MAFDGVMLAAIAAELDDKLIGGRIDRINQHRADELNLQIRSLGHNYRLQISAHATQARIHLTATKKENPMQPPLFCMVLRKHLEGGRLAAFYQPGLERLLEIKIEGTDELGRPATRRLIVEIMGKHSNIILVDDANGAIIDGIKRYSHNLSRHREVLPGRTYIYPPRQTKLDPVVISEEMLMPALLALPETTTLEQGLAKIIDGLSPESAREIIFRTGLEKSQQLEFLGLYEYRRIMQELAQLAKSITSRQFNPVLARQGTDYLAFSAVGLNHLNSQIISLTSSSAAVDEFYRAREITGQRERTRQSLMAGVNNALTKLGRKIGLLEDTLRQARETATYRHLGELLTANLYLVKPGLEEIEVTDFYDPAQQKLVIKLDSRLGPAANAQAFFKRYNKGRQQLTMAGEQLRQAREEFAYLESLRTFLSQAVSLEELAAMRPELIAAGYLAETAPSAGRKIKKEGLPLPPLKFNSSDGYEILVGRNNRQNDYLTQRLGTDDDYWFHTKDIPGAHVLIRTPTGHEVPDATLEEAALLAAYYSQARESSTVPVDFTRRKNVRKPKGAKPGMVIYDHQRTIYVNPRQELIEQIRRVEAPDL